MTFENVAFLFDNSILGVEKTGSVYGVLSFVGSSLYIPVYAKETINQCNFSMADGETLSDLLKDSVRSESLFNLLIKLYDEVDNLGITSFFIEKDYSAFTYLMGLQVTNIKVDDPNFRTHLDNLYFAYQRTYSDGIKRDNIVETVTVFNQRVQNLLQTQKEHRYFKQLLSEYGRKLNDQITVLKMIEKDNEDLILADSFFYTKQLIDFYKSKSVHDIYASPNAGKRFTESLGLLFKDAEVNVNIRSQYDENYEMVSCLAQILMTIANYYLSKIVDIKEIREFDEIDKYVFAIVWMILHGGDNNMFINGHSYEVIKEIFLSMKKDMDIK